MAFETNRVAYWRLDESSGNAVDSSGNNNTLVNNNSTSFASGKVNNCANLVAANSNYFSIADNAQAGLDLSGDCSFSFWIKMTSQPSGGDPYFQILNKWGEPNSQRSYIIFYTSGIFTLGIDNNGSGVESNDLYNLPFNSANGVFNHIVITWTASIHLARMYVNGFLTSISSGTMGNTSIFNGTAPFLIGSSVDSNHPNGREFLDAMLDEVMIWSRVLTSFEIRNYLNSIDFPKGLPLPTFFNV